MILPGFFYINHLKKQKTNSSVNEELLCSLKDELREVRAQIDACSEKLLYLLDQKKESLFS